LPTYTIQNQTTIYTFDHSCSPGNGGEGEKSGREARQERPGQKLQQQMEREMQDRESKYLASSGLSNGGGGGGGDPSPLGTPPGGGPDEERSREEEHRRKEAAQLQWEMEQEYVGEFDEHGGGGSGEGGGSSDWTEQKDPSSGKVYYWNTKTAESSWNKPEGYRTGRSGEDEGTDEDARREAKEWVRQQEAEERARKEGEEKARRAKEEAEGRARKEEEDRTRRELLELEEEKARRKEEEMARVDAEEDARGAEKKRAEERARREADEKVAKRREEREREQWVRKQAEEGQRRVDEETDKREGAARAVREAEERSTREAEQFSKTDAQDHEQWVRRMAKEAKEAEEAKQPKKHIHAPSSLPAASSGRGNWTEQKDPSSGKVYYWDSKTGESSWSIPPGYDDPPEGTETFPSQQQQQQQQKEEEEEDEKEAEDGQVREPEVREDFHQKIQDSTQHQLIEAHKKLKEQEKQKGGRRQSLRRRSSLGSFFGKKKEKMPTTMHESEISDALWNASNNPGDGDDGDGDSMADGSSPTKLQKHSTAPVSANSRLGDGPGGPGATAGKLGPDQGPDPRVRADSLFARKQMSKQQALRRESLGMMSGKRFSFIEAPGAVAATADAATDAAAADGGQQSTATTAPPVAFTVLAPPPLLSAQSQKKLEAPPLITSQKSPPQVLKKYMTAPPGPPGARSSGPPGVRSSGPPRGHMQPRGRLSMLHPPPPSNSFGPSNPQSTSSGSTAAGSDPASLASAGGSSSPATSPYGMAPPLKSQRRVSVVRARSGTLSKQSVHELFPERHKTHSGAISAMGFGGEIVAQDVGNDDDSSDDEGGRRGLTAPSAASVSVARARAASGTPARASASTASAAAASTGLSTHDPRFAPYHKMKKMRLPDGAVRQKMATNGMSDTDIAVFFGERPSGGVQHTAASHGTAPVSGIGSLFAAGTAPAPAPAPATAQKQQQQQIPSPAFDPTGAPSLPLPPKGWEDISFRPLEDATGSTTASTAPPSLTSGAPAPAPASAPARARSGSGSRGPTMSVDYGALPAASAAGGAPLMPLPPSGWEDLQPGTKHSPAPNGSNGSNRSNGSDGSDGSAGASNGGRPAPTQAHATAPGPRPGGQGRRVSLYTGTDGAEDDTEESDEYWGAARRDSGVPPPNTGAPSLPPAPAGWEDLKPGLQAPVSLSGAAKLQSQPHPVSARERSASNLRARFDLEL
jgi:hypothetical protein